MQIPIIIRRGSPDLKRVSEAVALVNEIQRYFQFQIEQVKWLPNQERRTKALIPDVSFRRHVARQDKRRPLIVMTSRSLRGGFFAFEHRDISVISTADWEDHYAPPPLKVYLSYQLAYIGIIVAADLSDAQLDAIFHRPKGCLLDESVNRDEFRIGMVGAHLCAQCEGLLAEMNTSEDAIAAVCDIMTYVRSATIRKPRVPPTQVFIGHGRAGDWKDLRDFLADRLRLSVEEFNSEPAAGLYIGQRVLEMLDRAKFAFLVMTGDDSHADATVHARENLIHEIGLCQGRLGLKRAVILKDNRIEEFSNLSGIVYIGFEAGAIQEAFDEITRTLVREGLIDTFVAEEVLAGTTTNGKFH